MTGKLNNLQAMRAVAAGMILVLHGVSIALGLGYPLESLAMLDPWANAGVDLFFVLSGYLMVAIQDRKARSPWRFAADRAARILPLYWFMLAIVTVAGMAGLFAPSSAAHILASFALLSQPLVGADPILYVGWTLEYEAWFYAAFAGAIALGSRVGLLPVLAIAIALMVMVAGAEWVAFEFLLGAMVARLLPRLDTRRHRAVGMAALAIGICGLLASLGLEGSYDLRLIAWGLPATLLLVAALTLPQIGEGALTRAGDASYALYLSHPIVLQLALSIDVPLPWWAQWAGAMLLAFLAGNLLHRRVELPLTEAARWLTKGPRLGWRLRPAP
ncbi:acyltransferase family protein [Sphingomicrobium sediminis]|uniref:Acyltransferase n=1 Tax=Sphingomicrobium sediminis TaxID=2950949 RepID=A0A9X2ELF4_9SPHN|nr:acyltransferase [Sphingomicrobium sediminis]MCM8557597.1 acyltransferase [Sphingomicrobium sediminis]